MTSRGNLVAFGDYWLKALDNGYVSNKQLESMRKVVIRSIKKIGKMWFRVFPDVPFTKRWLEMPMGKGKWEVDIYKARVRKGKILIEISGLEREAAELLFKKASYKLPIKTKLVGKSEIH
jgi:large subunit ribosomal protein L16